MAAAMYIISNSWLVNNRNQGRTKGRASWAAARGANLWRTLHQFLPASTKYILNIHLTSIGLKESQIVSLPRTPTCLGPAMIVSCVRLPFWTLSRVWTKQLENYDVSEGRLWFRLQKEKGKDDWEPICWARGWNVTIQTMKKAQKHSFAHYNKLSSKTF
jgi:hypothetical protein